MARVESRWATRITVRSARGDKHLVCGPAQVSGGEWSLPLFAWYSGALVEDALEAGVKVTGCTIHVAVPEVDSGPILAQEAVPVLDGDTRESLHERIKAVEHRLYPETIRKFLEQA